MLLMDEFNNFSKDFCQKNASDIFEVNLVPINKQHQNIINFQGAQLSGRALPRHGRGRRFNPARAYQHSSKQRESSQEYADQGLQQEVMSQHGSMIKSVQVRYVSSMEKENKLVSSRQMLRWRWRLVPIWIQWKYLQKPNRLCAV